MLEIKRITKKEELKKGQTILNVDHRGYESLEQITCIDNGIIWTKEIHRGAEGPELLDEYLESYEAVYEVRSK